MKRGPQPPEETDSRRSTRFPFHAQLSFKILSSKGQGETGAGRVIDMSGGGILFETEKPLDAGTRVKLSIPWPVKLNRKCNLKLVAEARVVRCRDRGVAVELKRWEFRTLGSPDLQTHSTVL